MSTARYPTSMRTLHWLSGLLIIGMLAVGFYMAGIPEDATDKYDLYPIHKALGMIVMMLVLIRLPVRWRGPVPEDVPVLEAWEKKLSHLVHVLLYVAMFSMTFSGYLMSSFFVHGHGVDMFGLFTVPDIAGKSEAVSGFFHSVHSFTAWSFVVLLVLHIGGALKHRFFDRPEADVLPRML